MEYRGVQYELVELHGSVLWTAAAGTVHHCSGEETTKGAAVAKAMTAIDTIKRRKWDALKTRK